MSLNEEDYYQKVRLAILVAFDLIIINNKGQVLVGERTNAPAKGFLFTPGGNVHKGETFDEAIRRISSKELGFEISLKETRLNGIYDQKYKENFRDSSFGSQYLDLAFEHKLGNNKIDKKTFLRQHKNLMWMSVKEIMKSKDVHDYVKNYFMKGAPNKLSYKMNKS